MKKLFAVLPLVLLLCFASVFAKEWSAEQKHVLNSPKAFVTAFPKGDVNEIMTYFHPKFTWWEYAEKLPGNYDAFRTAIEDFFKNNKIIKFDANPLEIQVEGKIAIMHLNYNEIFSDSSGKETTNTNALNNMTY